MSACLEEARATFDHNPFAHGVYLLIFGASKVEIDLGGILLQRGQRTGGYRSEDTFGLEGVVRRRQGHECAGDESLGLFPSNVLLDASEGEGDACRDSAWREDKRRNVHRIVDTDALIVILEFVLEWLGTNLVDCFT